MMGLKLRGNRMELTWANKPVEKVLVARIHTARDILSGARVDNEWSFIITTSFQDPNVKHHLNDILKKFFKI